MIIKKEISTKSPVEFLLISDVHIDSKHCNRKLLKSHLDEAKERSSDVLIFGDLFDIMQSRNDKRGEKSEQKNYTTYFNDVLDDAYEFLKPYKENLKFVSYGNHETKVMKYAEIDMIKLLKDKLEFEVGSYQGFILFRLNEKKWFNTTRLYYHHGGGGNAVMTMGVLNHKRASIFVDADIIVSGHNHESWQYEQIRLKCSEQGVVKKVKQTHLKLPTYQDESVEAGFLVEKWVSPKPLGGAWLTFNLECKDQRAIKYNIRRTND